MFPFHHISTLLLPNYLLLQARYLRKQAAHFLCFIGQNPRRPSLKSLQIPTIELCHTFRLPQRIKFLIRLEDSFVLLGARLFHLDELHIHLPRISFYSRYFVPHCLQLCPLFFDFLL